MKNGCSKLDGRGEFNNQKEPVIPMGPLLRSGRVQCLAVIALLMIALPGGPARGGNITGIVSFGDSLSDLGNFYAATGGASPPSPPYDAGRFSNGPIWLEYLAKDLGVAVPKASSSGGTDYAYGGAMTGTGMTSSMFAGATATVPNIGTQINTFLASNTPSPGQLFTIWGGSNDFLNGGQTNPQIPAQNIAAEIGALAQAGAKQILVANLPPLGSIPATSSLPAPIPAELNALSAAFNGILQSEVNQLDQQFAINIHFLNIFGLLEDAINNPSKYGFTNVTSDALGDGVLSAQGYLFWDPEHPTTAGHEIIGDAAAFSVVPEPSTLVMLATAMCGLAAWRRVRRLSHGHR
jgi:phospholipase/lecithinase/hemolysin